MEPQTFGGVTFTPEQMAENFAVLARRFYDRNFGQTGKSDIELLMFHFYIDALIRQIQNPDGTVDYTRCSDYNVGRALGILPSKARSLKVRSHQLYPITFSWQASLASLLSRAKFDRAAQRVSLVIPDPVLRQEIDNFLESRGWYAEPCCLKGNLLQMHPYCFVELEMEAMPEQKQKDVLDHLKKEFAKAGKDEAALDRHHVAKSLLDAGLEVVSILEALAPLETAFAALLGRLA